jgi:hypothetical protein
MTLAEKITKLGVELRDAGAELEAMGAVLRRDVGEQLISLLEERTGVLPAKIEQLLEALVVPLETVREQLERFGEIRGYFDALAEAVQLIDRRN